MPDMIQTGSFPVDVIKRKGCFEKFFKGMVNLTANGLKLTQMDANGKNWLAIVAGKQRDCCIGDLTLQTVFWGLAVIGGCKPGSGPEELHLCGWTCSQIKN